MTSHREREAHPRTERLMIFIPSYSLLKSVYCEAVTEKASWLLVSIRKPWIESTTQNASSSSFFPTNSQFSCSDFSTVECRKNPSLMCPFSANGVNFANICLSDRWTKSLESSFRFQNSRNAVVQPAKWKSWDLPRHPGCNRGKWIPGHLKMSYSWCDYRVRR